MQTIDPQSLMKRGLDALVKQAKGGKDHSTEEP